MGTPVDPEVATAPAPAVRFVGVTKRFGAVTACDAIDLDLRRGEVHGILGENGAGKSTLMRILIGLEHPDAGRVLVDGTDRRILDPRDAATHRIGMVHQHFSLVEPLTVWENIVLGERGPLDREAARARVREIGERYGLEVEPDAVVGDLSAGVRQRVEIIKCLRLDPDILVLDEPTSVLTPDESEQLFSVLRVVVEREGRAVALVSHKLPEIMRATDRVTILRRGAVVATVPTAEADMVTLAEAMVGRPVSLRTEAAALGIVELADQAGGDRRTETVLSIQGAVVEADDGTRLLDGLALDVGAGEIVGVAGVEGNGQAALGDVLSSLRHLDAGVVEVSGVEVATGVAGAMHRAGVGVIPEDRHDSGCVLEMSVAENLVMCDPGSIASDRGFLDRRAMRRRAQSLVEEYGIACGGVDAPMWSLSGGNQQRVVLARELGLGPVVLLAAQPTRGLDIGAIEFVSQRLREVADAGVGVLLISSDIEELLQLADRLVVLHRGRIVGGMSRHDVDLTRLGRLMGGDDTA